MADRRSLWAWGMQSQEPTAIEREAAAQSLSKRFGRPFEAVHPPAPEDVELRPPRAAPPPSISDICTSEVYERALHSYGHSYRDRVRKFRGQFPNPPDVVAYPREESDIAALLDWCSTAGYAAIPFGGASSVVGGVEPPGEARAAVSIDLSRMGRVLEVDEASRAARIQAGAFGPAIEAQLRGRGLTLRHFPQSFEFSTLGGWIATRSGGHYATNHTHIDDFVESVRMVTPAGVWESRRLPGSGAGPSPDRMVLGSEGVLGVVAEAWVRVQARPRFRESAGVRFGSLAGAAEAARAIVQAKLWPANCRVLDPEESGSSAGMDGRTALLVLGFESADVPQDGALKLALEMARDLGGSEEEAGEQSAVAVWRESFVRAPYASNARAGMGLIDDTFETAITWDRWPELDQLVRSEVGEAMRRVCGSGTITCRFTHVYPDGPAPYYTFLAPGRPGSELPMWAEIKEAASEAIMRAGGTITHHHAVGRDHRRWYDRQRPGPFAEALRAAKRAVDPAGVMNPGVLLDP